MCIEQVESSWITTFMDSIGYRDLSDGKAFLFGCDCGCLLYPMVDDVLYLDRYESAPGDCSEGLTNCACHTFPSSVPMNYDGAIFWSEAVANRAQWAAANPRLLNGVTPTCRDCSAKAVAFVIEPYGGNDEQGPHWVCENALGAPVPTDGMDAGMYDDEPEALVAARQQAQIMLAACPDNTCKR